MVEKFQRERVQGKIPDNKTRSVIGKVSVEKGSEGILPEEKNPVWKISRGKTSIEKCPVEKVQGVTVPGKKSAEEKFMKGKVREGKIP